MSDRYKIVTFWGDSEGLNPYRPMLYSEFLLSLRHGNDWFELIDSDRFYSAYSKVLGKALDSPSSTIRIAMLEASKEGDPEVALGWSLSRAKTVDYVFVKKYARMNGIGTALLPSEFDTVTNLTKPGRIIWKKKYKTAIFDPFI